MKTLALDLGTKLGYAYEWNDIESGTFRLGERGTTDAQKFSALYVWLCDLLKSHAAIKRVVYELPHHRGGAATRQLCGFAAVVQLVCHRLEVGTHAVHTGTIKKHATGSGKASKDEMVEAAEDEWPAIDVRDDNHADALWLLNYAEEML